jgi:negative regulator of flagellin synthesis FlgM
MKILGNIPKVNGVYDKNKNVNKVSKKEKIASKKDVVSISGEAKDYQTVMKTLAKVPDIRKDRIAELEKEYSSGTYTPDGKTIADKLVSGVFEKKA